MPLTKDIDIALAEYMYEEFILKGVQHIIIADNCQLW